MSNPRRVRRARATAIVAALLSALAGCATPPRLPDPNLAGAGLNASADRLILVTIANDGGPVLSEPGSTPHGYDLIGPYTVSDQAKAVTAALRRDYDLQEVRAWPIAPLHVQCLVFALPPQADRAAVLRALAADRRVRLAQPLQLFDALSGNAGPTPDAAAGAHAASTPAAGAALPAVFGPGSGSLAITAYNDPYFQLQHGFAAIEAGAAQQWSRGEGVSVAIIDTGVDVGHPDLAGRVAVTRNFIDDDMTSFASDRHGTGVAGIIGADANNNLGIVGVAPSVRLQIYKACQPRQPQGLEAQCNSFTLALALGAAIEARAQIVNLSLGGPADPLLGQLVSYGQRRGMVFVGAVPEDGRLDGFPLGIPGVIAVDQTGSTSASTAVLYAPGRDILSLAPAGRYDFATGSSFAAAHVTGAIALLRAQAPNLDATALFAVLERTRTHDEHGDRINVCAALAAVQPKYDCTRPARAVATTAAMH
ncbi:MAG: S8 family serine peptidase [Steroidobacterales bacterium]